MSKLPSTGRGGTMRIQFRFLPRRLCLVRVEQLALGAVRARSRCLTAKQRLPTSSVSTNRSLWTNNRACAVTRFCGIVDRKNFLSLRIADNTLLFVVAVTDIVEKIWSQVRLFG